MSLNKLNKKYIKQYQKLGIKYVVLINEIERMKLKESLKEELKNIILNDIYEIKNHKDLLESSGGTMRELLLLLGIKVNDFNEYVRLNDYLFVKKDLLLIEDYIDYINYKLGKYTKLNVVSI